MTSESECIDSSADRMRPPGAISDRLVPFSAARETLDGRLEKKLDGDSCGRERTEDSSVATVGVQVLSGGSMLEVTIELARKLYRRSRDDEGLRSDDSTIG
jgi:hypothetical protein